MDGDRREGEDAPSTGPGGSGSPRQDVRGGRFPREARIRKTDEIRAVFSRGKRRRTPNVEVLFLPSPVSRPRWGTVVPKHGRTIVERNRLRRRLREIGRTRVLPRLWEAGAELDVLVRARGRAYDASFSALEEEIVRITEELCSPESSSS